MTFLDEIVGNMSNKCTFINPNSPSTTRMKMKYSMNKVQIINFVKLPQSNFPDYTNSLTTGLFSDISRIPQHFQVSSNSR